MVKQDTEEQQMEDKAFGSVVKMDKKWTKTNYQDTEAEDNIQLCRQRHGFSG